MTSHKKKETLTNLDDTYLVPETCKRLQFQKKKKSIWKGFKSKKNKKDLDVLLQKVLKRMTTTSVMVVKSLEVMKTVVDIDEVKNLT